MIIGLYHHFQRLTARISSNKVPHANPRDAHAEELALKETCAERERVAHAITEQEQWVSELQGMINRMSLTQMGSAHVTLALRHLEDAQDRLLRSLGSKPPVVIAPQVGGGEPPLPSIPPSEQTWGSP